MECATYPTTGTWGEGKGERHSHVHFADEGKQDRAVDPDGAFQVEQAQDLDEDDSMPLSDGLGVCRLEWGCFKVIKSPSTSVLTTS